MGKYVLSPLIFIGGRDYDQLGGSKGVAIGKVTGKMDLKR